MFSFIAAIAMMFNSCGPHMYKTHSTGSDNVSYIIVLTESSSRNYDNVPVFVVVDDISYPYDIVYKVKAKRKAHPVTVEPGRHNVKVIVNGMEMTNENIFLGLQETKIIVLR